MEMFEAIKSGENIINLSGRFDASQVDKARAVFDGVNESCTLDFKDLDYISSAGLGVLLKTQKRVSEKGHKLKLVNLNKHITEIFKYAGFNTIFEIE